jgi:iron-sulfur cluster assembly protein
MINITETAANEILKLFEQQRANQPGTEAEAKQMYLRVAVLGGGCSGFKQSLELTDAIGESDEVFEHHGVKLVCDPKSHIYLDGTTIDYKSDVMNSGFVFDIPMASGQCGCGASFSA